LKEQASEMSYSGFGNNNQTNIDDKEEFKNIRGAFYYNSLALKFTSKLIIMNMATLVFATIKKTKRLHQPQLFLR